MSVEVVFDNGKLCASSRANRLNDILDFFIAARTAIDRVWESDEHHVADSQTCGFDVLHSSPNVRFLPGKLQASRNHIIDSDLLRALHRGLVLACADAQLWRVGSFNALSGRQCRSGLCGELCQDRSGACRFHHLSSSKRHINYAVVLVSQKRNFKANWICRPVTEPSESFPKLGLPALHGVPGPFPMQVSVGSLADGNRKFGVLVRLKNSPRN